MPIAGKVGGGPAIGFPTLPDIRIDEDTMNITIDTLLNITVDHLPRQGAVRVRLGGGRPR